MPGPESTENLLEALGDLDKQHRDLTSEIENALDHLIHGTTEPGRWLSYLRDLIHQRDGVAFHQGRHEALLEDRKAREEIVSARGAGSPASPDDWYSSNERDDEDKEPGDDEDEPSGGRH